MTSRSWDQVIADLAKPQHGVVSRRQLLALGMSGDAVRGRVRRGSLHPIYRGVYVVGYRRVSRKGGFNRIEVTCPLGSRSRHPGIRCHESDLAADEVTEIDGIPVTSLFRTLFDLAGELESRQLERAWVEVKVQRLTDRVPIAVLLERNKGKRGAAAIRRLHASTRPIPVTRNDFEERFLAVLDASDLPRGRFNAPLHLRGRFYELDCLWGEQKLIAELDGGEVHNTDHAFQSDRLRDRTLLAEGYRTIRITWEQLRDEPAQVVADLRMALGLD